MAKGSASIWRWIKRIVIGLIGLVVAVVMIALIAGAVWEAGQRHTAHQRFKPVGRIVDIGGGRHMHVDCRGQGSPTVVFESGLDMNGALAWNLVHDRVAAFTRACAYDRAGIMWSDEKKATHDGEGVAHDLHSLLQAAGEKGPFVFVGHSLGGPYIMNYARFYPDDVAGVVFVDASHPDQIKLQAEAGIPGATSGVPLFLRIIGKMGWSGLPRLMSNTQAAQDDGAIPTAAKAMQAESSAFSGTSMPAALEELQNLGRTLDEAGKLRTLGNRPLVVLTATKPQTPKEVAAEGMTPAQYARLQAVWLKVQNDEASWSTRSRHQLVPDSTHYIQVFRPDVVIAATKDVVDEVRADRAAKRPDNQK